MITKINSTFHYTCTKLYYMKIKSNRKFKIQNNFIKQSKISLPTVSHNIQFDVHVVCMKLLSWVMKMVCQTFSNLEKSESQ